MNGDSQPTSVRYRVFAVCSLMGVLLYLDRFCVSFAETYIKEDLGLSELAISWMFSAFFLTYALGQPTSGWLADRFGGRMMLTIYIFFWSLFTGLVGLANGVTMLVALRLGLGFMQAGAFPTAATLIAKWAPLTRRGFASGLVALGGRIGAVMSLFVTGYVILMFTPVEVPSTLAPRDILKPAVFCYQLWHGDRLPMPRKDPGDGGPQAKLGERLIDGFPTPLKQWTWVEAERERASRSSLDGQAAASPPATVKIESQRSELAEALNSVLPQPNFFAREDLANVKLELEAKRLLDRDQASLSSDEVQRLNRLVLEAVYPGSIKRVYCAGWRKMMLLYGAFGVPLTLLFWVVCRDEPRKHPRLNAAELAVIEHGRPRGDRIDRVGALPLADLLTSRSMWFNGAMQFFTNIGWLFLMSYAPRYFIEVYAAPVAHRTWMSAIPAVAACGGMFLGSLFTDRAVQRWGNRWGRSIPIALTRVAAGLSYLICLLHPSPWTAVAILAVTSLMCDLGIPAVWAFQQDVGGKYAGSVLGWGNMWGNLGAVAGPQLIRPFVESHSWDMVFMICAAAFLLSGICALGIDASRSLSGVESHRSHPSNPSDP